MTYKRDYFLDFVNANPLNCSEVSAIYEFAKELETFQGETSTAEIMDIIVQYYD